MSPSFDSGCDRKVAHSFTSSSRFVRVQHHQQQHMCGEAHPILPGGEIMKNHTRGGVHEGVCMEVVYMKGTARRWCVCGGHAGGLHQGDV